MKLNIQTALTLVTLAASGMLVPAPASAQDIWRSYPASACARESDWPEDYRLGSAGSVSNVSSGIGARPRLLHCPIPSDFVLRQQDIKEIVVAYDDRNTEAGPGTAVRMSVCNQALAASSIGCSDAITSSANGRGELRARFTDPPIQRLRGLAPRYYGYLVYSEVVVEIPKKAAVESSVFGIAFLYERTRVDGSVEFGVNRYGSDLTGFEITGPGDWLECQQACASNDRCRAWTYVRPGIQGPNARCWLKDGVPTRSWDSNCVSQVMR